MPLFRVIPMMKDFEPLLRELAVLNRSLVSSSMRQVDGHFGRRALGFITLSNTASGATLCALAGRSAWLGHLHG